MTEILSLTTLNPARFDRPDILKQLNAASRQLAELKGVAASMPNQGILISTLTLQEAKDSSEVENIVTTHDELFRDIAFSQDVGSAAVKEVTRYRQALAIGFDAVRATGLLTNNHILEIQAELEHNRAGFRKLPGTALKGEAAFPADPLVKMALVHHQFESIHPFYDGNGRTGRIINVLYLVKQGLLDIPVLYLSRHIVRTKADYYRLQQDVRERDAWEEWVLYLLGAVEKTAADGIATIRAIKTLLLDTKHRIRAGYRFYSQDLINNLFSFPYTKIEFIERDLKVSRLTATKYLEALAEGGFLTKRKIGRSNYYINLPLYRLLTDESTH